MKNSSKSIFSAIALTSLLFTQVASAQQAEPAKHKKKIHIRSMYASWGYNEEWYTHSTVHVQQNSLGNSYDLVHVRASDHKGWDQNFFHKAFTIPQYNYRLGFYINEKQDLAIEGNFDHTKYLINDGSTIQLKGTLNNKSANQNVSFAGANGFYYYLNNGANFLLFNLVKRIGLYSTKNNYLHVDLTGKVGIGPVIPHVQNSFFGEQNDPHFQFGGWNTGAETAVRVTVLKYGYLEFSQKVDYARYSNLKIYDGTAKQNFGTYELILSVGAFIPTIKHNPLFASNKETPPPVQDMKN